LELNLVTRGRGIYLLGNRKYELQRGDLLWLFPAQDHVLVEQSSDFRMWIGVFRRRAIRRIATDAFAAPLLKNQCDRDACRRLALEAMRRLEQLLDELAAAASEPGLYNSGLGYLLISAWKYFEDASSVTVLDLHPAV